MAVLCDTFSREHIVLFHVAGGGLERQLLLAMRFIAMEWHLISIGDSCRLFELVFYEMPSSNDVTQKLHETTLSDLLTHAESLVRMDKRYIELLTPSPHPLVAEVKLVLGLCLIQSTLITEFLIRLLAVCYENGTQAPASLSNCTDSSS